MLKTVGRGSELETCVSGSLIDPVVRVVHIRNPVLSTSTFSKIRLGQCHNCDCPIFILVASQSGHSR